MKEMKKPLIILAILVIATLVLNILAFGFDIEILAYTGGFFAGITAVYFIYMILLLIKSRKQVQKPQFDERQKQKIGECYKIAFFTLATCLIVDGIIRQSFEYDWSNYIIGVFTCIFISIIVYAVLAILKNAYTAVGENKVSLGISFIVLGLINLVVAISLFISKGFIENNQVTIPFINLVAGIGISIVGIVYLIKYFIDKKELLEVDED